MFLTRPITSNARAFVLRNVGSTLFDVAVLFVLLEIALRVFPTLVPPSLLVDFNPVLRRTIAERVGVSRSELTRPVERDDGGPPLNIYRPFAVVKNRFEDAGAVSVVTMDANGFCNPTSDGDGKHFDIIVLGDSITWCTGVSPEDTFATHLGALVHGSVYNMSAIGVGPYEYVQLAKHLGTAYTPRAVVLNIYEGNDLRDVVGYQEYRGKVEATGGTTLGEAPCSLPQPLCRVYRFVKNGAIGRTSYAFNITSNALRKAVANVGEFARRGEGGQTQDAGAINFRYRVRVNGKDVLFNAKSSDGDEVEYARSLASGKIDVSRFSDVLERFKNISTEASFIPIVTYTPSAYSGYGEEVVFEDVKIGKVLREASTKQRTYLASATQELGIRFLDFTPALVARARASEELLYFPVNLHLTSLGHEAVAEALAAFAGLPSKTQ